MVFTHRKDIPEMNFQTKSKQVYLVLFIGYVRDIPRFLQLNEFFFSIEHNMLILTSLTSSTKQLSLATVVNYNTIKTRWFSFNRNWILSRTAIKPWHVYPNLNTMYVIKAYTFIVVYTNLITKIKYQRKTICWAWLFIMYKFEKIVYHLETHVAEFFSIYLVFSFTWFPDYI